MLFVMMFMTIIAFSQSAMDYKAKIQANNKEMAKSMIEGNLEKSLSMYTADAISMPSYEPMQEGLTAIRKASEEMVTKGVKYNSFELTTVKVMPNGNQITEIGTYKISGSMAGMDKPFDDHGKYMTVWEKQKDGSLKVKIQTWNTDVDPMTMMKGMNTAGMEKK